MSCRKLLAVAILIVALAGAMRAEKKEKEKEKHGKESNEVIKEEKEEETKAEKEAKAQQKKEEEYEKELDKVCRNIARIIAAVINVAERHNISEDHLDLLENARAYFSFSWDLKKYFLKKGIEDTLPCGTLDIMSHTFDDIFTRAAKVCPEKA